MRCELLVPLLCMCGTAAISQSKLTAGSIVPEESVLQATAREHQPGPPTLLTVEPSMQQQLQAGMFRTLAGAAYRVYQRKAWCFDYSTDPEGRVGRPYLYIHFRAWASHLLQVPATHVICS